MGVLQLRREARGGSGVHRRGTSTRCDANVPGVRELTVGIRAARGVCRQDDEIYARLAVHSLVLHVAGPSVDAPVVSSVKPACPNIPASSGHDYQAPVAEREPPPSFPHHVDYRSIPTLVNSYERAKA
jgi:hypothetical protein